MERIACGAAARVTGTTSRSRSLTSLTQLPSAKLSRTGSVFVIELDVAAMWPAPVSDVATRVRDQVRDEVTRQSGVTIERVDVTVHVVSPDADDLAEKRVE